MNRDRARGLGAAASQINGDPGGIRTRVYGPPRAFLTVKGHSTALTKRDDARDLNSTPSLRILTVLSSTSSH